MKHKLLYLFPILAALVTGCAKTAQVSPPPPAPSGTFSGQFKRYHRHVDTAPFDSVSANITVKFTTPAFTYAVTGDTATLHAGSFGTFGIAAPYIVFNDNIFTSSPTKAHLSGYYLYNYDGTTLLMTASSADTLVVGYNLKKTSN